MLNKYPFRACLDSANLSQNVTKRQSKSAMQCDVQATPERLNLSEVSRRTGHSYRRLRRAIERGRLRAMRVGGDYGPYSVDPADLAAYLNGTGSGHETKQTS